MVMVADSELVTQARPSGAMAMERGAEPTARSARRARVTASKTETESLSGLTTQRRSTAVARSSKRRLEEATGLRAVRGAWMTWKKEVERVVLVSSEASRVTL